MAFCATSAWLGLARLGLAWHLFHRSRPPCLVLVRNSDWGERGSADTCGQCLIDCWPIRPPTAVIAGNVQRAAQLAGKDLGWVQNSNIQDLYSRGWMNSASLTRNWAASGPGVDRFAQSAGPELRDECSQGKRHIGPNCHHEDVASS